MSRKALVCRLLTVVALLMCNYYAAPASASPGCWNCEICSDGKSCCPEGSLYERCERWYGDMCLVYVGSCALEDGGDREATLVYPE